ncbi:ABC transporter substrate-binding protein [Parasedimentitalea huanghaiensis]|uniref:Extracellular solute-binding protein n=1 Tax=Parasedimentitalea huanghaiensis TaxID=2682100 RepID=A0A6L6WMI5_9RHOB|nr:extracellular solute-binding protein [Zongyanglinia huanghaiensis]MVO18229.1 extracellular solute-binding protein [Zongyanglinia huanghaiensis]
MKTKRNLRLLATTAALGLMLGNVAAADDAWQKSAGVGAYANETQDWAAIEAAAREEGQVVIYSVSSRIAKLVDGFKEKYGIDIIGHDMPSDLQIEKLRRENNAGVHAVDVLFNAEAALLLNEALPDELVWNFIPDGMTDDLDTGETEPFLIQRHSSRVVYYNTALNPDGAPIDSLWDLTRDEWKGRTLLPSPLEDSLSANFIQTVLHNAEEMAAAYEREFGEPITYSEGVLEAVEDNATITEPDAGMEWLFRFLGNEPVFQGSTTKIFKNVGDVQQDNPPLGITTFSKMRKNKEGIYAAAPIYDLDPVFGVSYPTALVMANEAPHPNAAKLLIRYMMEEDGFKPWNEPGDYAARSSIEATQVEDFNLPKFDDLNLWPINPEEIYFTKYGFLALYLALG